MNCEHINQIVLLLDILLEKYGYALCITDTKGSHEDLTEEYAKIPEEMKRVARYFNKDVLRFLSVKVFWEKTECAEYTAEELQGRYRPLSDRKGFLPILIIWRRCLNKGAVRA